MMMTNFSRILLATLFITLLLFDAALPGVIPQPSRTDKCPVCGMFVAKYRDWLSAIRFTDGSTVYFDGMKDLMTFHLSPPSYLKGRTRETIREIVATDYYTLNQIDALKAFYVIGSDVLGPMGKELIPFASRRDAEEFLKDHRGRKIIRFDDITPQLIKSLQ